VRTWVSNQEHAWNEQRAQWLVNERAWNERRALAYNCDRAIMKLCAYIFVLLVMEISLWIIGHHYEERKNTDATTACFVAMPATMALFFYMANKMLVTELSPARRHYVPLV
jgi:hypothetical protein